MTTDQYAPAVLKAGQDLGVTPRGIVIGFATVYVESGWTMYANESVPASMNLPHDAFGSDGFSVGLFQQQVVGPPWWWGDAATCMSPYKSALLFFQRLKKLDYNGGDSPGSYAQTVQQSAFPDRYDQHMDEAQALYDRLIGEPPVTAPDPNRPDFNEYPDWLSANYSPRDVNEVDLWLLHTQEPPEGPVDNDAAKHLRDFLESSTDGPNPVSYHTVGSKALDGGTTIIDCVDTDDACWAVGNSNDRSINFCFAGSRSDMSRQEWLDRFDTVIEAAAYLFVQDCAKYPKLQARVIAPDYINPPGAADHNYCTEFLKDGNNHTDVGPNFPWDVFKAAVDRYVADAPAPTDPAPNPAPTDDRPADPQSEILAQTRGRWERLGWQTELEALAEMRDHLLGTNDKDKAGFRW